MKEFYPETIKAQQILRDFWAFPFGIIQILLNYFLFSDLINDLINDLNIVVFN